MKRKKERQLSDAELLLEESNAHDGEEEFSKNLIFQITDIEWTASIYEKGIISEIIENGGVSESGFLAPTEVTVDFENQKIFVEF